MTEKDLIEMGFAFNPDEAGKYHFYYINIGNCDFTSCPSNGPEGVTAELMDQWYVDMDGGFRFYDRENLETLLGILHKTMIEEEL